MALRLARHPLRRARREIRSHYDLGNDFYSLWLDREMSYGCAYFHSPQASLEEAQRAKFDHVCRKPRRSDSDVWTRATSRPRFRGHADTLYGQTPRPLLAEAALLIGDAAGLAHLMSGEGIQPAVESGILAGRAVIAAHGDYTVKGLSGYPEALTARFGRRGDAPLAQA